MRRTRASAVFGPESAAKVPRLEAPAGELAPVLGFLAAADGVPEATRAMLAAGAPYSLRAARHERHAFQTQIVDSIAKVFAHTEAAQEVTVELADAAVEGHAALQAATAEALAGATLGVEAARAHLGARARVAELAREELKGAQGALAAAREHEGSLQSETALVEMERTEFATLASDKFPPMKEGAFAGKHWPERNRALAEVMRGLDKVGVPDSLREALPVALKTSPAERGLFASYAIEFAGGTLNKHVAGLEEKLDAVASDGAQRTRAAAEAQAVAGAKGLIYKQILAEHTDARTKLQVAKGARAAAVTAMNAQESRAPELARARQAARGRFALVRRLIAVFEALRCRAGGAPPPEAEVPTTGVLAPSRRG